MQLLGQYIIAHWTMCLTDPKVIMLIVKFILIICSTQKKKKQLLGQEIIAHWKKRGWNRFRGFTFGGAFVFAGVFGFGFLLFLQPLVGFSPFLRGLEVLSLLLLGLFSLRQKVAMFGEELEDSLQKSDRVWQVKSTTERRPRWRGLGLRWWRANGFLLLFVEIGR